MTFCSGVNMVEHHFQTHAAGEYRRLALAMTGRERPALENAA
jgi:hypothetical protein